MERKRSVCPLNCPDRCGIIATVERGRIIKLQGDPEHPFTAGFLCNKVLHFTERLYSPLRILHPMRRIGAKGEGKFVPISWEEALDEIVARFQQIVQEYGGEAILPYSYTGTLGYVHAQGMGHRFFHRLGATQLDRTICSSGANAGWEVTLGKDPMGPDPMDLEYADLIILWGINAVSTSPHLMPFVNRARKKGARLIVIDPYRNRTAKQADEHVMLRPGTDGALALGMMQVIINENRIDKEFIAQYTVGFDQLKERVQEYPPERVASITGLPVEQIRNLARAYTMAQTSYIRLGTGLSRHQNGGMAIRTITCLPGLTGAWKRRGGGIIRVTHGAYRLNTAKFDRKDLAPPNTRRINMLHLPDALLSLDNPPVKALFVFHSNPVAINPNQQKLIQGLRRPDLFTVVHEQVFTDTTDYADLVLPATTFLEHTDFYRGYGHHFMQMAYPVVAPLGESKPDHELFSLLAQRMGFTESCFTESPEEMIKTLFETDDPYLEGITYEMIASGKPIRLKLPDPYLPYQNGFPTPSGKIEFYSETLAQQGMDPLPHYTPLQEGPENLMLAARYPLQLIVPPAHHFLNSNFGEVKMMQRREGAPQLLMHPQDAAARKLQDGDMVRIYNDRGETLRTLRISEDTREGVVVAEGIWWAKHNPGGQGINQLTADRTADLGGGSVFHSNLVEVERYSLTELRVSSA